MSSPVHSQFKCWVLCFCLRWKESLSYDCPRSGSACEPAGHGLTAPVWTKHSLSLAIVSFSLNTLTHSYSDSRCVPLAVSARLIQTVFQSVAFPFLYTHPLWAPSSVQFSRSVMSDSLCPHEPQHARPPCPSPTPRVYSNSCPSSWWCHPAISSSIISFSSCPQPLPASGSFPVSQLFVCGGQSIGVSALASVFPMNTQDWSPLGWTGSISLQSKGLSRVFSNTTVQKPQFFCTPLSL